MRKLLLFTGVFLFLTTPLLARVDSNTMEPVVVEWSNDGIQIINSGNDGENVNAMTFYVVGGSTTSAVTYAIDGDSISFVSTGGLYPGTTTFLFSDSMTTIEDLQDYCNAVATTTTGVEGGVIASTSATTAGVILSTRAVTASGNCFGSANTATLVVEPEASQTSTVAVFVDSMTFTSTKGLYPGSTSYHFTSSTETLADLKTALEAFNSTDPGVDGTLTVTIPNGSYDLNLSTDLTTVAAQSILTTATLDLDTTYGISYIIPAGISRRYQWHITGITANATFGSGTTYLRVYDGTTTSDTLLLKYEIDTTATETPILCIPANGDFAGGKETRLRFDLIGSAAVTAGHLSIIGHKE